MGPGFGLLAGVPLRLGLFGGVLGLGFGLLAGVPLRLGLGFGLLAGVPLRLGLGFGLLAGVPFRLGFGLRLVRGLVPCLPARVVQTQVPLPIHAQGDAQNLAGIHRRDRPARHAPQGGNGFIDARAQTETAQGAGRVRMLHALRVVEPILRHAEAGVQVPFVAHIILPGAVRQDFQHPGRCPHFPGAVRAVRRRLDRAQEQHEIRRDGRRLPAGYPPRRRVRVLIVEIDVARQLMRAVAKRVPQMDAQIVPERPEGLVVDRTLRHRRRIDRVQRIVAGHQRPRFVRRRGIDRVQRIVAGHQRPRFVRRRGIDRVQRIVAGHQRPRRVRDAVRVRPLVLDPPGARRGREEGPRLKGPRVTGCDCAISHGLACAAVHACSMLAKTPPVRKRRGARAGPERRTGAPRRHVGQATSRRKLTVRATVRPSI